MTAGSSFLLSDALGGQGAGPRSLVGRLLQSRLMRWRYRGPPIEQLLLVPQDLRTADPSFASEIYHGHFGLAGAVAAIGTDSPFTVLPPNLHWAVELHGFGWLRHLRAADDQISREHARALIRDWIVLHEDIGGLAWRPDVVARRVVSWLSHTPMVLETADAPYYDLVMSSLARQLRYLRATHRDVQEGAPRLMTLTALLLAGLCAADREALVDGHLQAFVKELDRQILPDGGHVSRNPAALIELLLDLLPLRQCFLARDRTPPPALVAAIDRMMPMLRFFRLGGGGLARFNGMGATPTDTLATVLAYDDVQGKPLGHAVASGYCRLGRGRLLAIVDAGRPPPEPVSRAAHAGCLSFELSSGDDPIVVNCGSPAPNETDWLLPSRSTAAHSTVVVCDTSSSKLLAPATGDGPAEARLTRPQTVDCQIVEEAGDVELRASHDGYLAGFGIVHARRLRLSAAGDKLVGEDRLIATKGLRGPAHRRRGAYTVRFHLHPSIRAQVSNDGRTALLVTPHREGWLLTCDGPPLTVEESVYLADLKGPRRGQQIVAAGEFQDRHEARVGWTIERSVTTVAADMSYVEDRRPETDADLDADPTEDGPADELPLE